MKPEDFQAQMEAAVKQYDRCIVSLGLAPRDFAASLVGMVERAINQFVQRAPGDAAWDHCLPTGDGDNQRLSGSGGVQYLFQSALGLLGIDAAQGET